MDFFRWVSELSWSGFIPDLIVGLGTGVAVGLVLVGFERRLIDQRKQSEDGRWAARLERVEVALTSPIPFTSKSFRPDGDIVEHIERLCDDIASIHPKVAAGLPELMFLSPLLEKLDALRLVADRLERAMEEMLTRPLPSTDHEGFLLRFASDFAPQLRDRVREVDPYAPRVDLTPSEPSWNVVRIRMQKDTTFHVEADHYRSLLRQIEAFRSGFVGYRTCLRWEGHKRTLERIKAPNYTHPTPRQIDKENEALRKLTEPVLHEMLQSAYATVPGD